MKNLGIEKEESMQVEILSQLLYEDEGATLDFKRDQYPFAGATADAKSELLKDILGFINSWRRTEAFILIGIKEVQGGRSVVHGISEHLQDHALQQFVNGLTNRPVQLAYEACEIDGQQVGVIRIPVQTRPVFLKRDFGKLKRGQVYVRRGSSTDPTRPADPDEIASMGVGSVFVEKEANLVVEFAATEREQALGDTLEWTADFCEMPTSIPLLGETPSPIQLPGGRKFQFPSASSLSGDNHLNQKYFRELAHYTFFYRLHKKVRLVVINSGASPASDVRLEFFVKKGNSVWIVDVSDGPVPPKKRTRIFATVRNYKMRSILRDPGNVDVQTNDHGIKTEINCGNLQPGRKLWTDTFFLGIGQSGRFQIEGHLFSGNLSQPKPFTLSISAEITHSKMSIEELKLLNEPKDKSV